MKKLLFIPLDWQLESSPHQKFYAALAEKFDTMYYKDQSRAIGFDPDYIFVHSGSLDINRLIELKNLTNATIMQWTGDCRAHVLEPVVSYKNVCDLTILACGIGQKDMYEPVLGHKVYYMQHAVEDFQFMPVRTDLPDPKKIVFIGNNYDQFPGAAERTQLCKVLSSVFPNNFEVIGNGFASAEFKNTRTTAYNDTPKIYNESYIGISANSFNDIEGYYSNRQLDIMAGGSICLMRYTPNAERWFTDMKNCVFYHTSQDAIAEIQYLLDNPDVRNEIALEGQKLVLEMHTYHSRVNEIIEIIKQHEGN